MTYLNTNIEEPNTKESRELILMLSAMNIMDIRVSSVRHKVILKKFRKDKEVVYRFLQRTVERTFEPYFEVEDDCYRVYQNIISAMKEQKKLKLMKKIRYLQINQSPLRMVKQFEKLAKQYEALDEGFAKDKVLKLLTLFPNRPKYQIVVSLCLHKVHSKAWKYDECLEYILKACELWEREFETNDQSNNPVNMKQRGENAAPRASENNKASINVERSPSANEAPDGNFELSSPMPIHYEYSSDDSNSDSGEEDIVECPGIYYDRDVFRPIVYSDGFAQVEHENDEEEDTDDSYSSDSESVQQVEGEPEEDNSLHENEEQYHTGYVKLDETDKLSEGEEVDEYYGECQGDCFGNEGWVARNGRNFEYVEWCDCCETDTDCDYY